MCPPRIVLQYNHHAHSETLLQQLHWLPVHSRVCFKLATITYKALSTSSPQYLASIIHRHQPIRSLRSNDQLFLNQPFSRTTFGSRSFRCAAPSVWNSLPLQVRTSPTLATFKSALKTYLFRHPPA